MSFFKNLHPAIQWAAGLFFVEAFIGPLGTMFFEAYSSKVYGMLEPALSYLPTGLLLGVGIGLILALWLLRGRTKDWYKRFDTSKSEYRNQVISIASLMREYISEDGYTPIRKKDFYNCTFEGPGIIYLMHPTILAGNNWDYMGAPIGLRDVDRITGAVGFLDCHFENCKFRHITPVVPSELVEDFLGTFPPEHRSILMPSLAHVGQSAIPAEVVGPLKDEKGNHAE